MFMRKKALLVGINIKSNQEDIAYSMEELENLAAACGIKSVGQLTQKLERVNQSHYVGTGKLQELESMLLEQEVDVIIFDDELSPMQIRNLESRLDCEVIDRTTLILDIFAERAKTRESQLQVELAKLRYKLPRLIGSRESLGRQGGGSGLKNRGAGETKLELDRRKIEEKITKLNNELEKIVKQRNIQRKKRVKNESKVVSLVGYTNAGKSTTMNAVLEENMNEADKKVFEKNMLFATLETSVRRINTGHNKEFLLTDTVGFINKLPHHLVKAFRSTLEEVTEADLLVHVIDYSNPNHEQQKTLTNEILNEIGIENTPVIYVYNKADLAPRAYPAVEGNNVYLSASNRIGINELIEVIVKHVFQDDVTSELLIPYTEGQIVSYFNNNAQVLLEEYEEEGIRLIVECKVEDAEKFKHYLKENSVKK
ncbi:GTPase HflX [Ornithinibacillus salinisoli]|uniref:GTPase HflX n=1 Tax=Ornithinibacillus salinisoli TaxID=1848459 RepID=A0ABW4VUE4_9BACI